MCLGKGFYRDERENSQGHLEEPRATREGRTLTVVSALYERGEEQSAENREEIGQTVRLRDLEMCNKHSGVGSEGAWRLAWTTIMQIGATGYGLRRAPCSFLRR